MPSSDLAVSVRDLSKSYTIAHDQEKHVTLAETMLARLKNSLRGPETETFWALKDIKFDIKKGDVVGIIGRNGAGKSTLLKILSRITEPTTGRIDLYGRVGSLLEVGTGFHPELTGRENIFLNGAILGMSRPEIRQQFDAIVDFAGVEQFLDTPVKRYSSGMYVRLAFAVAAHLESEILVVDEVLAVGDLDFQRKCLRKMQDVGTSGRTVLFVSHQMQAVSNLCNCAIYLEKGRAEFYGDVRHAMGRYLAYEPPTAINDDQEIRRPGSGEIRFRMLACDRAAYLSTDDINIVANLARRPGSEQLRYFISFLVVNVHGQPVLHLDSRLLGIELDDLNSAFKLTIHGPRLAQGQYSVDAFICNAAGVMDRFDRAAIFNIMPILPYPVSRDDCVGFAMVYPEFNIEFGPEAEFRVTLLNSYGGRLDHARSGLMGS